ncbi:MAG: GGDEF domain-containing protein [Rhodocyclaceae bacterium]|nr:GGDEF domain-containing protein [Rhodocyclaceae bacterium]
MISPCASIRFALALVAVTLSLLLPGAFAQAEAPAGVVLDPARASIPLAGRLSVLEDPEHRYTIADVRGALREGFIPAAADAPSPNFGYTKSAWWLRIDLAPAEGAAADDWLLEVAFPLIDRIELYIGDAARPLVAGDRLPFGFRPYAHRNFVFPLADLPMPDTPVSLWLRVESEGTLTVPLTLWQAQALAHHSQTSYTALALYYGAILALLLYNLLLYFAIRDRSYLEYVLCVAGMLIGQLSLNGFGNQFLWPESTTWGHIAGPFGFAVCGLFAAAFTRSFLGTRACAPVLDRLLMLFVLLFALAAASLTYYPYRFGAMAASALGPLFAILAVACGLHCYRRRQPGAGIYLIAWAMVLLGAAITGARNFGLVPTNAFTLYALQVGSVLDLLLLSFALASRINAMRQERAEAQAQALEAKEQLVHGLQRSEQQLAQRVAERTQELAEVNEQLREKERHLQHAAHHDPLTGAANRLLLGERIIHALNRARRHNLRIAVLLVDLDGFKPVNDRYGHTVGDELLVAVAQRIRAVLRAEDTVARIGGDEFVVMLEDIFDTDDVQRVVSSISRELAHVFDLSEGSVRLGASVGYALFPEDGDSPESLVKAADKRMYGIKKSKGEPHAPIPMANPTPDTITGKAP